MLEGIFPVKLFLEKSMTSRNSISPILRGISPIIWLPEIERKNRFGMEAPIFLGIGPENLLLERSINEISPTAWGSFNRFGIRPCQWLKEIFSSDSLEEIFQNQLGIEPEMLVFDMLSVVSSFCDLSQEGNEGPKWHESISSFQSWNGGIQWELTFKVNELEDKSKALSFLRCEKWDSLRIPVKWLKEMSKRSNSESFPKLTGRVPLSSFPPDTNWVRCRKDPREAGMGPWSELNPRSSSIRFLSWPNQFGKVHASDCCSISRIVD